MTAPTGSQSADPRADPIRFGVGARITIAIMDDAYVDLILGALDEVDATGLVVETGDVSTYVGGDEADLLRYVTELAGVVAATGRHASISLLLSRGCPGEVGCDLPGGAGPRVVEVPAHVAAGDERTGGGHRAAAEWALYPLADAAVGTGAEPDHMRDIEAAIELARRNGTFRGSAHFVTRLEGDLAAVVGTVFAGWLLAGRTVQHVTSHATLSLNSPSRAGEGALA